MSMPKSVDGNHRDIHGFTVTGKNIIYGRVVNGIFYKNGLIFRKPLLEDLQIE